MACAPWILVMLVFLVADHLRAGDLALAAATSA